MTINQLEYFYAVAKSASYTKTAQQLYVSQPALSKSIAALEKELQVRLLERNTKKVALTVEGEVFAKTCEEMLRAYRSGLSRIKALSEDISGTIVWGVPSDCYDCVAMEFMDMIKEAYPGIRIELKCYPYNGLLRALDDGKVDFIFTPDWPRSENLCAVELDVKQNYVVLSKKDVLSKQPRISFRDLKDRAFVAMSYMVSGKEHDIIMELGRTCCFSPNMAYEAKTVAEVLMLVTNEMGVSVLSEKYRGISPEGVCWIPLEEECVTVERLIWRESENCCIQAIAKLAEQYARKKMDSKGQEQTTVT